MKVEKFHYFVSYAHSTGFGNAETITNEPIKSIQDTQNLAENYASLFGVKQVVVLNFQLLKQTVERTGVEIGLEVDKCDLQIGDMVKTIFSGNEIFTINDIRTIHAQKKNSVGIQYELNEYSNETPWLYREQLIPIKSDDKITCRAEFRLGSSHYTREFIGTTENEISELINAEIKKKNSHYVSSKNI